MTDLMTRLQDANPVSENERPPIGDVWRKLAASTEPAPVPSARASWQRTGRVMVATVLVAVPVILVAAIALTVFGAGRRASQPAASTTGQTATHSTLDARAQHVASTQLAGRVGTVVALDPRTGAIRALITAGLGGTRISGQRGSIFQYRLGSAFEIVTAAAALDSGRYTAAAQLSAPAARRVSGVTVRNASGTGYGRVTLSAALRFSANTAFAQLGADLGPRTMTAYMRRLGFFAPVRIAGGRPVVPASGVALSGRLVTPLDPHVAIGPLAVGGAGLIATPLQMAMVASAVARDGTLMAPHLDGRSPTGQSRVMSVATARALTGMLRRVVTAGTGTPADLRGAQVAGMTGTLPLTNRPDGPTDVWFVGFAPAAHPTVAIAVAVELDHSGFGGTIAGPIAARVIASLLRPGTPGVHTG